MTDNYYENILRSYDTMITRSTPNTANAVLSDIQASIRSVLRRSKQNNKCTYPGDCPDEENHRCTNPNIHCSYRHNK